jgi:hypothetical protein
MATYVLNSVTFPEDRILRKVSGIWYEVPTRALEPEIVSTAAPATSVLLGYEWITTPVTLGEYEQLLNRFFPAPNTAFVKFPLGTVKYLKQLIDHQLTDTGTVLIGEIGATKDQISTLHPISFTQDGAPFIHTQMPLLATLAQTMGIAVKMLLVENFIGQYNNGATPTPEEHAALRHASENLPYWY